jgi:hypothetical protein
MRTKQRRQPKSDANEVLAEPRRDTNEFLAGQSRDTSELLVGTWVGISLIADALLRERAIGRESLTESLVESAKLVRGDRLVPLLAMLYFIEQLAA